MLHHIGIEVRPADIEAAVAFFELIGFAKVEPPPTLRKYTWLEREGTQVHLMPEDEPTVPVAGHLALVVPDFEATTRCLRDRGFEIKPKSEHWGAPRALVIAPGGHRVELMAAPPAAQARS